VFLSKVNNNTYVYYIYTGVHARSVRSILPPGDGLCVCVCVEGRRGKAWRSLLAVGVVLGWGGGVVLASVGRYSH